ncbi:DUF4153 domain-containing protein [Nocardia sp. NPDC050406]|uniref:DUF4153 domain-containing protein n=1 Tax=Nocardia sp. NPDC050406 TaxID=3364318 RepID=UPI00378E4D71
MPETSLTEAVTPPPATPPTPAPTQVAGGLLIAKGSQPVRQPPRSMRVAFPNGVLAATAASGIAAALLIPADRPGIGWFLFGLVAAAAIVAVHYRAGRTPVAHQPTPDANMSTAQAKTTEEEAEPLAAPAATAAASASATNDRPSDPTAQADTSDQPAAESPSAADDGATVPAVTSDSAQTDDETSTTPAEISAESTSGADSSDQALSEASAIAEPANPADQEAEATTSPSLATSADPAAQSTTSGAESMSAAESAPATTPQQAESVPSANPSPFTRDWARIGWSALALALLAVGTFRAAEWLFVCCLLTAMVAGSLAVVRRSVHGVFFDMCAVPVAALTAIPWLYRGVERVRQTRMSSNQRVWWSLGVTVLLLVVFVPLLAGADAVFATLVDSVVPALDMDEVRRWAVLFPFGALGVAGALYLLAGPPLPAKSPGAASVSRRLSRVEWGLPVGALTALFAVFVATQLAVLFGGDGYVQRTSDLTYAEYARSGFWQLSIVSILTLAVIAVVQRLAAQESTADRTWLRIALTAVSLLTLVIVASALSRMWLYQQAYGFTVMRLLVEVFELWIALLYLLLLASLVRLRHHWLPRAAVGAGAATLLVLAILNPERFVAERNIDSWEAGERLDTWYLSQLSADVLPAAERLPEPLRSKVVNPILADLEDDPWRGWNMSRSAARR